MSNPTSHFYLFGRNPYVQDGQQRRTAHGFPDEGFGIKYTHANRATILGVVNTVYELGTTALFPVITELLAPANGGVYDVHRRDDITLPPTLLMWDKLHIRSGLNHNYATHAVHFSIQTETPSSAVHLALIILHLTTDTAVKSTTDRNPDTPPMWHPRLVDLAYSITPSSAYGTAYFIGMHDAYKTAVAFADQQPFFKFSTKNSEIPVTTLPESDRSIAHADAVLACYRNTT
ncbi:hypothetical protein C2E23DRAFT_924054 [Lenzites betulinus]|nr:hypothetical protein C2E23DRAFT_924054 [Lenzites betulinus]